MPDGPPPVLWHISMWHYSEKVRWAIAYKGIPHKRRAPLPGLHPLVAFGLTRKHRTVPSLELDGTPIGDSSAILAALEARHPDPPLYPSDRDARQRALELEDYFDEELGPAVRLLGWHEIIHDPESLADIATQLMPPPLARFRGAVTAATRTFVDVRYGVRSSEAADRARTKVLDGLDRLETELGEGDYLAGGSFSVADLTAAALFYPIVSPPEAPQFLADPPEALARFRAPLEGRRGYLWVEEMYRRHRQVRGERRAARPVAV